MTKKEIYDQYAASALQALIAKSPFFDTEGELGTKKPQKELNEISFALCKSAHAYAFMMMETRDSYLSELKELGFMQESKD